MKFLHLVILAIVLISPSYQQQCNEKGMRKFDSTVAKFVTFGGTGRKFPTNKDELKKFCREEDGLILEMDKYKSKCFKGLSKQMFGVLLYSLKNLGIKNICKRESQRQIDILEAAPCINRHDDIITKCYTTLLDGLIGARNAQDKLKIPHMCCDVTRFYQCVMDNLAPADGCNEKHAEVAVDFVRDIVRNAFDLICGDYTEGSDKCTFLGPSPKKKRNQRRNKSFAIPVLELLSSFPEV